MKRSISYESYSPILSSTCKQPPTRRSLRPTLDGSETYCLRQMMSQYPSSSRMLITPLRCLRVSWDLFISTFNSVRISLLILAQSETTTAQDPSRHSIPVGSPMLQHFDDGVSAEVVGRIRTILRMVSLVRQVRLLSLIL